VTKAKSSFLARPGQMKLVNYVKKMKLVNRELVDDIVDIINSFLSPTVMHMAVATN
jgi:hypothetical protein